MSAILGFGIRPNGFSRALGHLSLASFLGHKDFVNNLNPKCFEWNPKQVLGDAK